MCLLRGGLTLFSMFFDSSLIVNNERQRFLNCGKFSSERRSFTQRHSLTPVAPAIYSDSIVDDATTDCFLEYHEIGTPFIVSITPVVDFASGL